MLFKIFPLLAAALLFSVPGGLRAQNLESLGEYRIALVGASPDESIFWGLVYGARGKALELEERYSIEITLDVFIPASGTSEAQAAILEEIADAAFDAIVIHPPALPTPAWTRKVETLHENGTPMISVGRTLDGVPTLAAFPANEFAAGQIAAETLVGLMVRPGIVGILHAADTAEPWSTRLDGIHHGLGRRRVLERPTERNHNAAVETLRALQTEPGARSVSGLIFVDDWPLLGETPLFHEPARVRVVSFMSGPTAIPALRSGAVHALVAHPFEEWGRQALAVIIHQIHDRPTAPPAEEAPAPRVHTRADIDALAASWSRWLQTGDRE